MATKRPNKAAVSQFLDIDFGDLKTISEKEIKQSPTEDVIAGKTYMASSKDIIVKDIDPNECQPWQYADRPDGEMGDLYALAESMKQGQAEPVLARPVERDGGIRYEIIFGNRRWRAAKQAGLSLKAIIQSLTDQEASLQQELENAEREDISDFSKAMYYQRLLKEGVYKNESQLAKSRGYARNTFNALMSYTRIPSELISTIKTPQNIAIRLAVKLATLSKDQENFSLLLTLGDELSDGKITSANVEKTLDKLKSSQLMKPTTVDKQAVLSSVTKKRIFTLESKKDGKTQITLDKSINKQIDQSEIIELIRSYIDEKLEN